MAEKMDEVERRRNPTGWVPPKAPYNPYDPTDIRPAQGYPSEFLTPGKERTWTSIPKDADEYKRVRDTMKKLSYTPRPPSEIYPGQFKMLRRVVKSSRFASGSAFMAKFISGGTLVYAMFIHRWNDGYENIFSPTYRFRLKAQLFVTGYLSEQQYDDLIPKQRGMLKKGVSGPALSPDVSITESAYHMERPSDKHFFEAERILQEREERLMKAIDIAEAAVKNSESEKNSSDLDAVSNSTKRKRIFGIF